MENLQHKGNCLVDEVSRLAAYTKGYETISDEEKLQLYNISLRKFIANSRDALRNLEKGMWDKVSTRERHKP
jgi:hypothetical protein